MLEAFVGPANGRECSHEDNNRQNNVLLNLAWRTKKENEDLKEVFGTRLRGQAHPATKMSLDDIQKALSLRATGVSYEAIGKAFGVSLETAYRQLIGREEVKQNLSRNPQGRGVGGFRFAKRKEN